MSDTLPPTNRESKPIWPLGKDDPNCICGKLPNVNCLVHITKMPLTRLSTDDAAMETIIHKFGVLVGLALINPDEAQNEAIAAIKRLQDKAVLDGQMQILQKLLDKRAAIGLSGELAAIQCMQNEVYDERARLE